MLLMAILSAAVLLVFVGAGVFGNRILQLGAGK
jgi:hypothetical protein